MGVFRRVIVTSLVTAVVGGVLVLSALGTALEQGPGLSWLFNLRGPVSPPSHVMIVSIDIDSAVQLEQPTKLRDWNRSLHADLVRKLEERGAATIVFDIFFDESQSQIDDQEFAQEIRRAQRVILVQQVQRDQIGELMLDRVIYPAPELAAEALGLAPFPLPKVRNRFGQFWAFYSGVSYSSTLPVVALQAYVLEIYGYENFVDLLKESGFKRAEELPPVMTDSNDLRLMMGMLRADFKLVPQLFSNFTSRLQQYNGNQPALTPSVRNALLALAKTYNGADSYYLNFYGPPDTVTTVPYATFSQSIETQRKHGLLDLHGKVVFIGGSSQTSNIQGDGFFTVFSSKDGADIDGVEIAATAFANLLEQRSLRPVGAIASLGIVLVFGGLVGFLTHRIPGVLAVPASLTIGAAYFALVFLLFIKQQIWIPVVIPVAIQLPLALFYGYFSQYLSARQAREKYSRAIRYYVPERVAQRFDEGRDPAKTPELEYGICMSTDVDGYTTLAETIAESELAALTNEYFGLLGGCVENQKGEMLEIRGDGMNCVWTVSQLDKHLGHRACYAAREILNAVDIFNREHPTRQFPTRVGLHAGRMALGNVGGGGHLSFSIVGDSINTASRIQELNKILRTQLLASEAVVRDLDNWLIRRICSFQPKGKSEVLSIFEVFGPCNKVASSDNTLCEKFAEAIFVLETTEWSKAADMFEAILSDFPTDGPTAFYLERCRKYRVSPPVTGDQTTIRSGPGHQ